MKRFITIILIILVVVGVILTGAWLLGRRTAQNNGTPVLSFRQFLTGTTKPLVPNDTTGGTLSSVFVDNNLMTSTGAGAKNTTIGTNVAQFTNDTTSPSTSPNGTSLSGTTIPGIQTNGSLPGQGVGIPKTTTTTTTIDPTIQPPATVPPIVAGPDCSDADLNIRFTPSELAQLQVLQNKFYALSQNLHTDADVSTETGNHDNFKTKIDKISYLYNKCTERAPQIVDPQMRIRIPTPFWHELAQDSEMFVSDPGLYDGTIEYTGSLNPSNTPLGLRTLERSLRLNLW